MDKASAFSTPSAVSIERIKLHRQSFAQERSVAVATFA